MSSQVFTTIGSSVWNWPTGVTSVTIECIGGGGGSGTASGNPATGGGGKGGSYAKATITKGTESNLGITVGAGGAVAAAGGPSYVTQLSTTVCQAPGGGGGATQAASSANGAGGTTTSGLAYGTTNFDGGNGGTGNFTAGTQGSGAGGGAAGPASAGGAASVNVAGTAGSGTFQNGQFYSGAGAAGVGNTTAGIVGPARGGGASGGKANSNTDQVGKAGGAGIVVLTWTDVPVPPLVAKVQSSGKVVATNVASFTITMPSAPTVGNSLVLGLFGYRESVDFIASITDNRGNTYQKAADGTTTNAIWLEHASIWYCGNLAATGGPFIITVTCVGAGTFVNADAIEYAGPIALDQVVAGDQSFTYTPTLNSPAVSAGAVLSVGVLSNYVAQTYIGIPAFWVKEVEDLTAGIAAGSIVTHGPTPSAVENAAWVVQDDSWTAVALAVFRSAGPQAVGGGTIGGVYARAVVSDGAVGYWRFAGGSFDPTVGSAGSLVSGTVATVPGQFDEALSFNGTVGKAQVVLAHAAALNLTTTGTLEAWLKLPANSVDETLFAKGAYGVAWGYGLARYSSGSLLWRRNAGDYVADSLVLPLNVWFHLAVTVDSTPTIRAYVNGVLYTGTWSIGAGGTGAFFTATTQPIGVAHARSSSTPSEYLTGIVDELAIYPTVLTATQIAQHVAVGVYAPSVTRVGADQAVSGATVPTGALTRSPSVTPGAVTLLGATLASSAVLRVPSVTTGSVEVIGATVVGAASVFVATVTPGPVTVTGATVSSVSQTLAPAVTAGTVTLVGATRASMSLLLAPSVTTGAVTVVGATCVGAASVFGVTVTPGAVLITGATLGTGSQTFAPAVTPGAVTLVGATRVSTSLLFVPSVATGPVTVLGMRITATTLLGPPTLTNVAFGSVGTEFLASTVALHTPTVVGGLATILVPTISADATSHPPSVGVGATTIFGGTCATTVVLFVPSVTTGPVTVLGATRGATSQTFAAAVTTGAVTVVGATRSATSQVFAAAVSAGSITVGGATCGATSQSFAAAVSVGPVTVLGATCVATSQPFVATVTTVTTVGAATILATISPHAPTVTVPAVLAVTTATLGSAVSVRVPIVGIVGLWRVNGTGLVRASGPVSSIQLTLPSQPAVGNAIVVVMAGQRDSAGMTFGTCTDNQSGHVYSQGFERRIANYGEYAITVYYLPRIKVSTGQFTITVTGLGTDHCFEGCAIEVGGLTGDLGLASYITSTSNSATVNSGSTAALNGQHFVAALCVRYDDGKSITVQALTPPWVEEYEELMGTWLVEIAGEGDSRVATFSNVGASVRWTLDAAAPYVAGIAAFKVGIQAVGGATIPTTASAHAGTVAVAFLTVLAARIASGAVLRSPVVLPGPVTVQGATILSATTGPFAPTITPPPVTLVGATCASTTLLSVPSVTTGPVTVVGATIVAYPQTIVTDGATHYWRLNEASGTGATDSVTNAVGVITGGVTLGEIGASGLPTAMLLAPTGKIAVGAITFGAAAFTMEAWARIRTELEPEGRYLSAGQDAWPMHGMGVRCTYATWPENILFCGNSDNIGYVRLVGTSALGRTWHHHVMTYGNRTIRLYVDGVLEYTSSTVDLTDFGPVPYQIGDVVWDGWLENVALYDRALTAVEVSAHAALGRTASAFAAGVFAPTVAVEVRGSTIPTTASLAAPTVQAAAVEVIAGTLARTSLTYPPGVLIPIRGATILKDSALYGPRVSLVDDRQLVTGAFIQNDAGMSRVMDVFDLLTIGPWLLARNIYAPGVAIPPNQPVATDAITNQVVLYAPLTVVIVPIAATTIARASRVFLPMVTPGSVEVGPLAWLSLTTVLLPPAVANPDRFGALTGVAVPSTLGALAVENLNPLTGATTLPAVGIAGARVSGIVTGVLTPSALATGTVTAIVPLPGARGVTAVGTVQHSTDTAALRGVIAGAVLKPLAVQIVVGASGLEIASALGVLSAPRFATVTGVPAQTQLALLSAGTTLPASPVFAVGDIGTLDAFNGVFVFVTGVAATATNAALGPQQTIAIAALPAVVPALGTVGRTLTVALPALPTTGQIGALGAQSLYTQAVTGVAAQSTVGAVTRATSVPLTATALIATAGVVGNQQRVAGTGTATSAVIAPVLPEHLHLLVPALSVGRLGTVGTLVEHVPVTVTLVGVAATGDVGVFTPTSTRALTTVLTGTARGALGTTTAPAAVTGTASLSTLGLAKPGVQIVVPAVTEIGTVGALGITRVWAVTGVRGLPTVGALGHQTDAAITGLLTTTDVTTLSPAPGLSGVTATGAVGTVGTARTRSTVGVSVHAAAGIVPVGTDAVLTTVAAASAVGDLAVLHQLAGVTATSATGALAVTVDRIVPAVLGTTAVGTLRRATVVGLAGVETATAVGTVSAGADVTTALLNVRAWGTVGTLGRALDLTLIPAVGIGAVGDSVARPMPALAGVQTTSAVGTVTIAIARQMPDAVGQGRVNTTARTTTVGLTGVEALGEVGRLGVARAWQAGLTGVRAAVSAGAAAVLVAPALTWVYVIGRTGHVGLTVDGGRTLTGVEADISQGNIGIVTRTLLTGTGATGRTGLLAGAGERLVTLTPAVGVAHIGVAHPLIQMPVVGVITTTASADALGVEAALTLRGIRAIASPGVIGVTGADAPPEILDFTVVVKREEMLTATVETVLDGWCVVCREAETVVEVEPEPDYFSPVIIQRAPALHPLSVVAVKPEYLDVTVAVTQSITVEALRSGVVDEVHLSRRLDLDASLDADLDVSVRILIEQTYAVETER